MPNSPTPEDGSTYVFLKKLPIDPCFPGVILPPHSLGTISLCCSSEPLAQEDRDKLEAVDIWTLVISPTLLSVNHAEIMLT